MTIVGKWGYSGDGEHYSGAFDSREEAIAEGGESARYVGQFRAPICEEAIDGQDLIEKVTCQDDYCGDWAEDALDATPGQVAELTAEVRACFGAWLDRHGLRPSFGIVEDPEEVPQAEDVL